MSLPPHSYQPARLLLLGLLLPAVTAAPAGWIINDNEEVSHTPPSSLPTAVRPL